MLSLQGDERKACEKQCSESASTQAADIQADIRADSQADPRADSQAADIQTAEIQTSKGQAALSHAGNVVNCTAADGAPADASDNIRVAIRFRPLPSGEHPAEAVWEVAESTVALLAQGAYRPPAPQLYSFGMPPRPLRPRR